jgi:hypothetical protein
MQLFVAEENPWRKFPSERTCVTGLTKFGRVLLNLFFLERLYDGRMRLKIRWRL